MAPIQGRPTAAPVVEPSFQRLSAFLERRIGITLGPDRAYLARSRLAPVLSAFGLRDLATLMLALERQATPGLVDAVIDAMTTHETLWFRDRYPFDVLPQHVLPARWQTAQPLRVWSAACSTGQEPYSLAITLEEYRRQQPRLAGARYDILGTDVSGGAIAEAEAALYDGQAGVRGLSPGHLERYFERQRDGFALRAELRRAVRFCRFNLLEDPAGFGVFDLVFLRNVLIYFSEETQRRMLDRVLGCLAPGGWLVLGTAETAEAASAAGQLLPRRLGGGVIYQRPD